VAWEEEEEGPPRWEKQKLQEEGRELQEKGRKPQEEQRGKPQEGEVARLRN
jgi:hypothetical protein